MFNLLAAVPTISLIAALDLNRVIGCNQRLPWHLPADLRRFRRLTLGKPLLMGRRTWESLPGLLPERIHIVVSRNPAYVAPGCIVVHSPAAAITAAATATELFVIGGAQLFAALLPQAQRLYLTEVQALFAGDAYFPAWKADDWIEIACQNMLADANIPLGYRFVTLDRRIITN